jgi:hypothetical protein
VQCLFHQGCHLTDLESGSEEDAWRRECLTAVLRWQSVVSVQLTDKDKEDLMSD